MAEQAVDKEDEVKNEEGGIIVNPETGDELAASKPDAEGGKPEGEQQVGGEGGGDDDEGDERLTNPNATDAEREAIRERRREEKRRKKENWHAMKRELAARDSAIEQLQEQLNVLQRKSTGGEIAQLDSSIKQTADAYAYYKAQIADATSRADGAAVADATEKMLQAQMRHQQLTGIKQAYSQRQAQPAPLDPRVVNQAQTWMDQNDWYDPGSKDEDAEVLRALDNRVAQEGYDPRTPEYWEELTRRGKKYLPHRFTSQSNPGIVGTSRRQRPVVAGSGRDGAQDTSSGAGAGFHLSSARVQAIKEAGAWNDPKRRAAMIKRFQEYDRNNGQR